MRTWAALICCMLGCASVVPADLEFASARCQTVLDDGVEGLPTFDIAAILELTNPDGTPNTYTAYDMAAMQLAVAELNNGNDVAGRHFRVRVCDTRSYWYTGGGQATRDMANWLIDREGVQAIISNASADTADIASVAVRKGVAVMALSSTAEALTYLADQDLVWRVSPSDVYQGAVLAQMVTSTIAADAPISVIHVNSPYGNGILDAMQRRLPVGRVNSHPVGPDGQGLGPALEAAQKKAPGALVLATSAAVAAQVFGERSKYSNLATLPVFLSDGACDSDLPAQKPAGGASMVSLCTRPGQPPSEAYKLFQVNYKAKFAKDPAESSYTAHAYDVVWSLALAHAWATGQKGAGTATGKALAEGLKHLSSGSSYRFGSLDASKMIGALAKGQDIDVEGASGALDFNPETGEAPSGYEVFQVDAKGELKHLKYYQVEDKGKGQIAVLPLDVTPP